MTNESQLSPAEQLAVDRMEASAQFEQAAQIEIQLSPAEIAMIEVIRKQKALEAEKAEIEKQARLERDIAIREKEMVRDAWWDKTILTAAYTLRDQLGEDWKVTKTARMQQYTINDYKGTGEVLWRKELLRIDPRIEYKHRETWMDGTIQGKVGYRSYRETATTQANEGVIWELHGPASGDGANPKLKRAETINNKVVSYYANQLAKQWRKAKILNAIDTTKAAITARFEGSATTVEFKEEHDYIVNRRGRRHNSYISYWTAKLTHANGIVHVMRIFEDGQLGKGTVTLPKMCEDRFDDIAAISTIQLPQLPTE